MTDSEKCERCGGDLFIRFSGECPITDCKDINSLDKALSVVITCKACGAQDCDAGYYMMSGLERIAGSWTPIYCGTPS